MKATHRILSISEGARLGGALLAPLHATDPEFPEYCATHPDSTIIAWSGRPEPGDPGDETPAWLPSHRTAFLDRLGALDPILRAHRVRLLIRPHAHHHVSDTPSAASLLNRPLGAPSHIGLALDPVAMLEPSMVPYALDHVRRTLEALAHRAAIVIASDPAPPIPPTFPAREILGLIESLTPPDCPIAHLYNG